METTKYCLSEKEIELVCKEYLSGMTPQAIADNHYCSRPTIRNHLIRCGITLRKIYQEPRYPVAMILHDWQSGMSTQMIASTYGFSNKDCAYNYIRRMRASGYKFGHRKKTVSRDKLGRFAWKERR